MPVVDVYDLKRNKVGQVELPADIYEVPLRQHLVHEVVVAQLASRRSGTASTKARSDVAGTTHKMYRQKGTGRARAGSRKSPLRRGGGTIFGPSPKDWSYSPPKRVRRTALKVALSSKLKEEELLVIEAMDLERIKTKDFVSTMNGLGLENALIITADQDENLELSSRNVPGFKVLRVMGLNVYDVIKYRNLVLLKTSLPKIEERLLK
ncbi:MAG: 50S ribosomal protein L4 [Proteobacteria bacterium]|nr:50S ribosomal protein L4 [Pseudomonadota bacterium]